MSNSGATRSSEQFNLRLPDGMRERIAEEAAANRRSMNAEIVARLQSTLPEGEAMTDRHQKQAYPLRLPEAIEAQVREGAERSGRSINAEIAHRLSEGAATLRDQFRAGAAGADDLLHHGMPAPRGRPHLASHVGRPRLCVRRRHARCSLPGRDGMSAHTPGPWEVHNLTDVFTALGGKRADGRCADGNDGWQIADCTAGITFSDCEEHELPLRERQANARLIAAAPDLLQALGRLLVHSQEWLIANGTPVQFEAALDARAAIARATGLSEPPKEAA